MGFKPSAPVILDPDLLTVGQETISRIAATASSTTGASGSLRLTYWTARKSGLISQVRLATGATAAGATPTLCRLGLYVLDGSNNGSLIGSTPNDTSLFAASSTSYTRSLSVPVSVNMGSRYAWSLLIVSAATMPSLVGVNPATTTANETALAPRLFGVLNGQVDLPNTFLDSALSVGTQMYYIVGS